VSRVLLTGGTGFVGRQILKRLLARGCHVRMAVRTAVSVPDEVEQMVVGDLFTADRPTLENICADIDVVCHAAWYAVPGRYLTADENIGCLSGSLRLGQAAIVAGVPRFVGVGTCFEYDLSSGYLRTDTTLAPATLYGACKASAYLSLSRMMEQEGRSFAWCRLFYLYGEGEDDRRLVPYIRSQLAAGVGAELTSGKQIRDYLDVQEAGRMIADSTVGSVQGALNICSGRPVTLADMAFSIADEFGRRDLIKLGARRDGPGDPSCVFGEPSVVIWPEEMRDEG
jgi:dTDP-6-deoxy-L-talose 4-dehydrogenase (NAD+)